jgi:hypothetical protein
VEPAIRPLGEVQYLGTIEKKLRLRSGLLQNFEVLSIRQRRGEDGHLSVCSRREGGWTKKGWRHSIYGLRQLGLRRRAIG